MSKAFATALLIAGLLLPSPAGAQNTVKPSIDVTAVGGFLGLREGFCEDPGGTFDWQAEPVLEPCRPAINQHARSVGGLLGVARRLASAAGSGRGWLVVTGNNLPLDSAAPFTSELAALRPTMVALGSEDIVRLVAPKGSAAAVVSWVRDSAAIPLLATNVAIRRTRKGLNVVDVDRFKLRISPDSTVGWNDPLVLQYTGSAPVPELQEFLACPAIGSIAPGMRVPVALESTTGGATLKIDGALRPGRCYALALKTDAGSVELRFESDLALTPRGAPASDPLAGFPVVLPGGDAFAGQIGVALVDPAVKERLPAKAWKWSEGGTDYEFVVADAAVTLAQIAARTKSGPAVAMIAASSMSDDKTLGALEQRPEVRILVLPPETSILGRAASAADAKNGSPRYSGDLAFSAVVDAAYPEATRIMVRPEWFGETIVEAAADFVRPRTGAAHLDHARTGVTVVPGAVLSWTAGPLVAYSTTFAAEPAVPLTSSQQYENCQAGQAVSAKCALFISLWESPEKIAAVAANALRKPLRVDIVAMPLSVVDADFLSWLNRRIKSGPNEADWISKFTIGRVFFDDRRIVRAFVAGSDVPATLEKLAKAEKICFVGLGDDCKGADKDHLAHLLVNSRPIDGRLYYALAVPDALAEQLQLTHDDVSRAISIVHASNEYLASGEWFTAPSSSTDPRPHATRSLEREGKRYRAYAVFPTVSGGYGFVDPPSQTVPGSITDFPDAKPSRTLTAKLDGEIAPLDASRWAIRVPMHLDYSYKKQEDSRSFDSDEFSLGAQLDRKFVAPLLGDVRLFGGAYVDGPLQEHPKELAAAADLNTAENRPATDGMPKRTQTAPFKTPIVREPSRFRSIAAGLEVLGLKKALTGNWTLELVQAAARLGRGYETRVPKDVTIGGESKGLETFLLKDGDQLVLDDYYTAHLDTFAANTPFQIATVKANKWRAQFNLEFSGLVKDPDHNRSYRFTYAGRVRLYRGSEPVSNLEPRTTQKHEFNVEARVWKRLSVTPAYVMQVATIARPHQPAFRYQSLDVKVSLPVAVRWGRSRLFQ
jgi:hypothetical protein